MILIRTIALIAAMIALTVTAVAVEPDEILDDRVLGERARDISRNLRCLVCQNESIDESNADLAKDLRLLVRERLVAGDSDEQVIDYIVARYGDFVLLRPRLDSGTYLLWFGPFLVLCVGALAVFAFYRRHRTGPRADDLTDDERRRLADILKDGPPA